MSGSSSLNSPRGSKKYFYIVKNSRKDSKVVWHVQIGKTSKIELIIKKRGREGMVIRIKLKLFNINLKYI